MYFVRYVYSTPANLFKRDFTARRYASAVCAVAMCMSACPSVSHRVLLKQLNVESRKHTQLYFTTHVVASKTLNIHN